MVYKKSFEYLAFDHSSQVMISHGGTAVHALWEADRKSPDAPIYILCAGETGWLMWNLHLNLSSAEEVLARGVTAEMHERFLEEKYFS